MKMSVLDHLCRDAIETRNLEAPVNLDADPLDAVISDIQFDEMIKDFEEEK